jgi:hypothetical protein
MPRRLADRAVPVAEAVTLSSEGCDPRMNAMRRFVFVGGAELVRHRVRHRLGDGGRPGEGGSPDDRRFVQY